MDISTVFVPIISVAVSWINGWLIKQSWFSLVNRDDKGKKHISALVLALVLSSLVAVAIGFFNGFKPISFLLIAFNSIMAYAGSVAIHEIEKNARIMPGV